MKLIKRTKVGGPFKQLIGRCTDINLTFLFIKVIKILNAKISSDLAVSLSKTLSYEDTCTSKKSHRYIWI